MYTKCKLQLGKHLINHQAQTTANKTDISNDTSSDSLQNFITQKLFDEATSQDWIKIQQFISDNTQSDHYLINAWTQAHQDNQVPNEIFLIDNGLREPLLTIDNKLLGRQHLNFDQLTPPEQELWKLFKKSEIYEFLSGEKSKCLNSVTIFSHSQLHLKWTLTFLT